MNTERRSKTKRGILVAILLVCIIAIIGGTYSRYSSSGSAEATATVAKWAVAIKGDGESASDISSSTATIPVTFKVTGNENVVTNKFAPATTAVGEIELDLTGTEVAVDVTAVPDLTNVTFASKEQLSTSVEIEDATDGVIALEDDAAFTSSNGKKTITVTLEWEHVSDESNNGNDTTAGAAAGTITVPVTITVQQHIASSTPVLN